MFFFYHFTYLNVLIGFSQFHLKSRESFSIVRVDRQYSHSSKVVSGTTRVCTTITYLFEDDLPSLNLRNGCNIFKEGFFLIARGHPLSLMACGWYGILEPPWEWCLITLMRQLYILSKDKMVVDHSLREVVT